MSEFIGPQPPGDDESTGAAVPPRSISASSTGESASSDSALTASPVSASALMVPPTLTSRESPFRHKLNALLQRSLTFGSAGAALIPLLGLVAMLVILLVEALPAIRFNGWGFFTSSLWSPGNEYASPITTGGVKHLPGTHYGAWALIAGTLESSAIAIIVALPVGVGAAVLIVERLPRRLAAAIGLCLEVLAGVPSVVIGLWGIFAFGPFLARDVYPTLAKLPNVPVLNIFRGGFNSTGQGLLTGGLVLAAMILPLISATTRDLLRQVPGITKEGAQALGMTEAEAFRTVQARWVRTGVIGAAVLGLGRALGETIAIALVSGSVLGLTPNIYGSMTTIAAAIVTQLDSAQTDPTGLAVRALAEAALVLLLITLLVNIGARMIVRRAAKGAALPLGAGF